MSKKTNSRVYIEYRDASAAITLNRPEVLNSLAPVDYASLADAIFEAGLRDHVDVITITGQGRAFCTGGDLKSIREAFGHDDPREKLRVTRKFADASLRAFTSIERAPQTVIAVVNGICQAGGLSLALCADLVIASEEATFSVPEGLVGLADPYIPVRLARCIGTSAARMMMYTAETVTAKDALRMGLINDVVPARELQASAEELVSRVKKTAPTSRRIYKRVLNEDLPPFDAEVVLEANASVEANDGVSAFIERKAPPWAGPRS